MKVCALKVAFIFVGLTVNSLSLYNIIKVKKVTSSYKVQGFHITWKSWENGGSFSSHENSMEFFNFEKVPWRNVEGPWKNENLSYCYCTFLNMTTN